MDTTRGVSRSPQQQTAAEISREQAARTKGASHLAVPPPADDPIPRRDIVGHLDFIDDLQVVRPPRSRALALGAVFVAAALLGIFTARRGELVAPWYRILGPRAALGRGSGH